MGNFKQQMTSINNDDNWSLLEKNYDNFYITGQTDINIPKKIHQIWLGGKVPDNYIRIMNTWLEKNPDYEYKLWTDDDIESLNLENIELYNTNKNLGVKSDILRYEILYRYGGIYIDTDFECIKNFDDLLYLDLFSGTGHVVAPETYNGLIACKPKHGLLRKMIDDLNITDTTNYDKILAMCGPHYFSKKIFEWIKNNPDEKNVVFPTNFFYSFPSSMRFKVRNDNEVSQNIVKSYYTDDSYCVHLWYTSWQK